MTWKDRFTTGLITDIEKLNIGDLISWENKYGKKRYGVITRLDGPFIWANFNYNIEQARNGISDCGNETNIVISPEYKITKYRK